MNNVTFLSTNAGRTDGRTFTWFYILSNAYARDVNKATDFKAKAKARACKAKAKAEAEASVPWHKLVIMHNIFKTILQYF